MSNLKSTWEISLDKSNKMNPGLEKQKKLTEKQKSAITEVRREYGARIADKEVNLDYKLNRLSDRVPPEQLQLEAEQLNKQFIEDKTALEKEMEQKVESIRQS